MKNLPLSYLPLTADPFGHSSHSAEILPGPMLKPYIRCFWGSSGLSGGSHELPAKNLIIPDTCSDIIFHVHYDQNRIDSFYCGINDAPFFSQTRNENIFGIRFYAWSACLFSSESLKGTKNHSFDVDVHFPSLKHEVENILWEHPNLRERSRAVEILLQKRLKSSRQKPELLEAVYRILKDRGSTKLHSLNQSLPLSSRQLQRNFQDCLGLSPKGFSSLIRYQSLWRDILFTPGFTTLDGVEKYGYTDQSHLLKDFKRFHGLLPSKALETALAGGSTFYKDIAFLQDFNAPAE